MLIYLALLERIAPLGGGHDVFIKDAISESYPHTKEESHKPSTCFLSAQKQGIISPEH